MKYASQQALEAANVMQAAADALETLNGAAQLQTSGVNVSSVTKFVRNGNKLIRVHVSFMDAPATAAATSGEGE